MQGRKDTHAENQAKTALDEGGKVKDPRGSGQPTETMNLFSPSCRKRYSSRVGL